MREQKRRTTAQDKKGNQQKLFEQLFPLTRESGYGLDRHVTTKEAILEWIKERFDLGDLEEGIAGGIQNASSIDATQEALVKKTTRDLTRYLRDESLRHRDIRVAKMMEFEIGDEVYFQGPDAIVVDIPNRTIETIRYKAGAATGMTSGIQKLKPEDFRKLEKMYDLYADRCWAVQNIETLVPEFADGNPYFVECNYYFMKKTTDKADRFDTLFFEGGGNSVVGFSEKHQVGEADHPRDLDELFAKYVEQAQSFGFECDKDNCTYCSYVAYCQFTRANVKQEKKEVKATALGTPTPAQQAVIDIAWEGPGNVNAKHPFIKVNAGAGSGKTFTMVYLVIDLLKKGYKISDIFVTSFTNAGVNEIRERIAGVAKAEGFNIALDDVRSYTFDSFFYQMVSANYQLLGFPEMPKLLKADIQRQYVEDLVNENIIPDIDYGRLDFDQNSANSNPWVVSVTSKAFDLIQTYHIDPDGGEASVVSLMEKLREVPRLGVLKESSVTEMLRLYTLFEARLMQENRITYSHLQGLMERLYALRPDLYELGYRYVITDEFQDSSLYQVETIKRLSQASSFEKLIVVGDDAQAIYGFRDTTPEYIIHFDKYIGHEVKDMFLLENRRSTPEILHVGNAVIALNEEKVEKALIPQRPSGEPVILRGFHADKDERSFIVTEIQKLIQSGKYKPEDICVIARNRSTLNDIGTRLTEMGIPWISRVGQNLLQNSKVKAALALCDAFYTPDVTSHYFDYLVARHNGHLEELEEGQLVAEMEELKNTFCGMDMLEFDQQREIFHGLLDALKEVEEDEIYNYFLELLYEEDDLPEELAYSRVFKKYGGVMQKKLDQAYAGITLVTSHSSKGLEWPVCFVTVSGFDDTRLHRNTTRAKRELEETRRLLFVSATRARDLLYLTGTYVSSGNEKDGYNYNLFLRELHEIMGVFYDPIDHEKEAERARKREEAALKKAMSGKKGPSRKKAAAVAGQTSIF